MLNLLMNGLLVTDRQNRASLNIRLIIQRSLQRAFMLAVDYVLQSMFNKQNEMLFFCLSTYSEYSVGSTHFLLIDILYEDYQYP
jgi:hypothetical protein